MRADTIKAALDDAYGDARLKGPNDHDCPVRPSAFSRCARETGLLLDGISELPVTPSTRRLWEFGDDRGDKLGFHLKRRFPKGGFKCSQEVPVWVPMPEIKSEEAAVACQMLEEQYEEGHVAVSSGGELLIKGAIDFLAENDDVAVIIDFKSRGVFPFGKLESDGVKEEDGIQVMAYRAGLLYDRIKPVELFMVQECRDSDARKGLKAGMLDVRRVSAAERMDSYEKARFAQAEVIRAWMNGTAALVKEPYPIGGKTGKAKSLPWNCNYCKVGPMRGDCYGDVENRGTATSPRWCLREDEEEL